MSVPREANITSPHTAQQRASAKRRAVTAALLGGLVALGSATARAAPPRAPRDAAAAQGLFYEARGLMRAGRYAEACPKLEESLRLDVGTGTTFNLADCNEHLGKLAAAWSGFLDAAAASKAAGQVERERVARDRAAKLEAKLPKLVVEIESKNTPPGLVVERDGVAVGPAAFGGAIPVDPGIHRVVARAPGYQDKEAVVQAREGQTLRVAVGELARAVTMPATAAIPRPTAPASATSPPAAATVGTTTTTSAETPPAERAFPEPVVPHGGSLRTVGWVTVGLGTAALGGSAYFGLRSIDRRDQAEAHCRGDLCDARGVDLRAGALRSGDVATALAIGGGAAVLGGLLLVVLTPRDHDRGKAPARGAMSASASPMPGGGALVLGGTLP
jgi:hypothetical protein